MSNVRLSDQSIAATWLDAGTTGNFIAIAALGVALLLNAPNPHAQATRSLNGAATVFSGASAFFPPRVERDTARGRIWTLNQDMVLLYDGRTRTLVKKIALAGWSSVSEPNSCPADLAVDVAGRCTRGASLGSMSRRCAEREPCGRLRHHSEPPVVAA